MQFAIFSSRPEIQFAELFGRAAPIEIEIGSGKGGFLLESARLRRDMNFLGIENQPRWIRFVERRLERFPLPNVRFVCADARLLVPRFFPDESVDAYHVYFPDPWWKRRHRKRLVMTDDFVREIVRTLKPSGVLHLATDVAARFRSMLDTLARFPFEPVDGELRGRPPTNFERKYGREGRAIHFASFRKAAKPR